MLHFRCSDTGSSPVRVTYKILNLLKQKLKMVIKKKKSRKKVKNLTFSNNLKRILSIKNKLGKKYKLNFIKF